jgi:urease accessory protein
MRQSFRLLSVCVSVLIMFSSPAFAHSGHGSGFSAGFTHPMSGADHVLAMVAVGIWASMRGNRAILFWPLAFAASMVAGFCFAQTGSVIPHLEPMILSSVILLGAVIAFRLEIPISMGAVLIGLAGMAHGFAHGLELHGAIVPFTTGFFMATVLLHAAGIGIGITFERLNSHYLARLTGGAIMIAGAVIALS